MYRKTIESNEERFGPGTKSGRKNERGSDLVWLIQKFLARKKRGGRQRCGVKVKRCTEGK